MSAGILRNWHLSKVFKAVNPIDYCLAIQEYMMYEMSVFNFNLMKYF